MTPIFRIADLFAGAGGTSDGALQAIAGLGKRPELTAINHWPVAVATHQSNHPDARVLCTGVDAVNPRELFSHGSLDMLWASPECTHHSIARGGRPINDQSRSTAWCVVRWAEALRPPIILVENVPEFENWGPCGTNGRPLVRQKGATFQAWVGALRSLGYQVDWRVLCAADFGDPTTRKRLFIQAVCGRRKVVWPNPTHSESSEPDLFGSRRPWVPARDIIDWSLLGQSIYDRARPLSAKTLARIEAGLKKFGLNPFVASWDHQSSAGIWPQDAPLSTITTKARHGVVEPFIVPNFGERPGQLPRTHAVNEPLPTVTSHGAGALVQPFLIKLRGTSAAQVKNHSAASIDSTIPTLTAGGGHLGLVNPFLVQVNHGNGKDSNGNGRRTRSVDDPLPTVCGTRGEFAVIEPALLPQQSAGALRSVSEPVPTVATAGAIALVEPFLVKYYGTAQAQSTREPLDTITTKDRHALVRPEVMVNGEQFILDIRFRMLQPHELAAAQGFRPEYQFSGNKTEQVKQIGNAVPRRLARALVAAAITQRSDVDWLFSEKRPEVSPPSAA